MDTAEKTALAAPAPSPSPGWPLEREISLPLLSLMALGIGLIAGLGAFVLRALIGLIHNLGFLGIFSITYDANQFDPPNPFGPLIILVPVIGGLIVVFLVRNFAPEAKGHGVPEVMDAIYHKQGNVRGIVAVIKSLASAISIGSGASVGREGPIIQIGASFGSTIARLASLTRWQRITLLAAGGGAGIAATFNTPLGGVLFAVEMLLPEVSARTFLPVVVATATATYIGRLFFGIAPAFIVPVISLPHHATISIPDLLAFIALGFLCGVAAWAFVRVLAYMEDLFPTLPGGDYIQNIIGMTAIGVMMYVFMLGFGHGFVDGVGYATIQAILTNNMSVFWLMALLFVAKLLATTISLGSGASGGIFSPSLFMGATLGGALGGVLDHYFPGMGFSAPEFAIVGMAAMVGGATDAAMTAIVMIFEMTRDYNIIVPVVTSVAIAVSIRRALIAENIYTIKLRHRGRLIPKDRHTNMYLIQSASELMTPHFKIFDIDTPLPDVHALIGTEPLTHLVVADGNRIAGFVSLCAPSMRPGHLNEGTLRDVLDRNFLIARDTDNMNFVMGRMSRHKTSVALVAKFTITPRPQDVIGIVDSDQIASAVIRNHYE